MNQAKIDALMMLAERLGEDRASAIALLLGALTIECSRALHPAATIGIAIDSLKTAKAICERREGEVTS